MKIPVVTGTGRRTEIDSDGWPRLVLAEACDEIDPQLWDLFAEPQRPAPVTPAPS